MQCNAICNKNCHILIAACYDSIKPQVGCRSLLNLMICADVGIFLACFDPDSVSLRKNPYGNFIYVPNYVIASNILSHLKSAVIQYNLELRINRTLNFGIC